jgi:hypothetical protein
VPISYHIDPEMGAVFSRGTGIVTAQELLDMLAEIFGGSGFSRPYRELCDFCGVERLELYSQDARQTLALAQDYASEIGKARVAIVTCSAHIYGIGRMLEILAEALPIQIRPFDDEQEARRWLDLPERPQGQDQE